MTSSDVILFPIFFDHFSVRGSLTFYSLSMALTNIAYILEVRVYIVTDLGVMVLTLSSIG
jgi:hypothetical protein